MKIDFFLIIIYLLQEGSSVKASDSMETLKNIPIPKTFQEILGTIIILGLSPAVFGTLVNAWLNKKEIKDTKQKELEKIIQNKSDESYKKDIQIEILKVRLENLEKRNQELQSENRDLKEQTNTGFTRQEQMWRDHIKNLERELENERKKNQ